MIDLPPEMRYFFLGWAACEAWSLVQMWRRRRRAARAWAEIVAAEKGRVASSSPSRQRCQCTSGPALVTPAGAPCDTCYYCGGTP